MRVALVSTYPPAECGIANYTQELVRALCVVAPDVDVTVVGERLPDAADMPRVVRAWHRAGDWVGDIDAAIARLAPDIVHVQHEESFFGQGHRFLDLLSRLGRRGLRTVVTPHTVYDGLRGRAFHARLARVTDRVIAHQHAGMASVLERHGFSPARISLIAHGTPSLPLMDRLAARQRLGLPTDVPLALFFGFIHYGKRVHVALEAFERVAAKLDGAQFVVAGRIRRSHPLDRFYAQWIERKLRRAECAGHVLYRPGFVTVEDKAAYYSAADLIVLPHDQPYGSASGVLHEAIGAGRPVLCTRGKKFAEAIAAVSAQLPEAFPAAGDTRGWQQGFLHFLRSDVHRQRARELLAELRETTSWSVSARLHADLYRRVEVEPALASRGRG